MTADWTTEQLEDCLDALIDYRGKSPTKSDTGIPVLSAKVVKTTGLLRPIEQTIAPDYYKKWMSRGYPKPGDVIMTTEAPLGEVIQLDAETASFALGQRIVCLRGKSGKLDNTFLRYLLTSPMQQEILASRATGTTVLGISQKALRSMPVSFPSISEQRAIGSLLSALDDKIELNRKMNATLEAMARALFRDWFVDFGPTRAKAEG
ncbi:MAG: restriction endonuclease subunit S, partial [Gemmobacter sp.]